MEDPVYTKVGALDYRDTWGSLTPVFSCSHCYALVVQTDDHTGWHKDQQLKHVFGGLI